MDIRTHVLLHCRITSPRDVPSTIKCYEQLALVYRYKGFHKAAGDYERMADRLRPYVFHFPERHVSPAGPFNYERTP